MSRKPKQNVDQWREAGHYLPDFLKDFHDQKDVFKTIHQTIDVEDNTGAREVSWVAGHCYVIDVFLWFMAKHGYTLQRSRANVKFADLNLTLGLAADVRSEAFASMLGSAPTHPED